jgi:hypothetical protein
MRFVKFIVPAVALGLFAAIPSLTVRADDAPAATQPAASGSVTIKVVDASGNPVEGAKVLILPAHKKGDPAPTVRPSPVAQGVTDAQGSVTLTGLPDGKYRANANLKGVGHGSEKVSIGADVDSTTPITITLQARARAAAPATQPAQ